MRALALQNTGLECTFHGVDLLINDSSDSVRTQAFDSRQTHRRSGARIIGVPDALGNLSRDHFEVD